ncbi:MAG TPA: sialidase family protein, partial [Candidatus Acidoferrales bacterium]|nr:sialidase family protein [Candidatus Acidoferrales bacterium]
SPIQSAETGELAAYDGAVFAVFEDNRMYRGPRSGSTEVLFRRSLDGGTTWQPPRRLRPDRVGSSRPRIVADQHGTIFVTWDEGWGGQDNSTHSSYGVYMSSADRGEHWSDPLLVDYPTKDNVQLAVGSDGRGGVLLVWRNAADGDRFLYFMWSSNWGSTWSPSASIPGIAAPPWDRPLDSYPIVTDSQGRLHLLAVGVDQNRESDGRAVFHLAWDGRAWSPPATVYSGGGVPEDPQLAIGSHDDLHATWTVVNETEPDETSSTVLYAQSTLVPSSLTAPRSTVSQVSYDYVPEAVAPLATPTAYFNPGSFDPAMGVRFLASLIAGGFVVGLVRLSRRLWLGRRE